VELCCVVWCAVRWRVSSEKVFVGAVHGLEGGEGGTERPRSERRERERERVRERRRRRREASEKKRERERDQDSNKIYYRRKMTAPRDKEGPMRH